MNILIMSDSHGNDEKVIELTQKYPDYLVIHLGDRGFSADIIKNDKILVDGNCDFNLYKKIEYLEYNNHKILITHGDLFDVKYGYLKLKLKALEDKCDIVLFGHTHFQEEFYSDGIHFINPGALKSGNYAVLENNELKMY